MEHRVYDPIMAKKITLYVCIYSNQDNRYWSPRSIVCNEGKPLNQNQNQILRHRSHGHSLALLRVQTA